MDIRKFFGGGGGGGGGSSKKSSQKKSAAATSAKSKTSSSAAVPAAPPTSTNAAKASANSSKSSPSNRSPPTRRESPRKVKRVREEEEEEVKLPSKTKVDSDVEENDDNDDAEEEEEDYLEQARKRRAAARGAGAGTGGSGGGGSSKASSGGAGSRRRVIQDDDDDDDVDEVMKDEADNGNDDDNDADFQPNADNDDDDDDETDEPARKQLQKKKASPAKRKQIPSASEWSPPKRSSPRKSPGPSSTKKSTEGLTSTWSMPKTSSVPPPANPPKYHPPSSKLTTHIPFLQTAASNDGTNSNKITLPHATLHDLPPLPKSDNFLSAFTDDITITPHCLDGLTFVFTGILSTNDASTSQTNAQVALSSPSKSDYYTNRRYDCSNSSHELSRDTAVDIIKCLGGRVTTMVSGKTDYVICGHILEDGRIVTEGSKYKKCVELWEAWSAKWRKEYNDGGNDTTSTSTPASTKKKKGAAASKPKKDQDPNTLVEVIHGIQEFYGLVKYLSEWKMSTLSKTERSELDARQMQSMGLRAMARTKAAIELGARLRNEKEAVDGSSKSLSSMVAVAAAASNPSMLSVVPSNPYAKKAPVANPYAKSTTTTTTVANPYAKSSATTSSAAVSNPYTKKSLPSNPYTTTTTTTTAAASSSTHTLPSQPQQPNLHPGSGKELGANSLWADKYAPSNTKEILGNSDSVNKLSRWLSSWEKTFNNPKKQQKGSNSGPNGPWRAALLSGPPGIGKIEYPSL